VQVYFYTRADIQECGKIRRALDRLKGEYNLQVLERVMAPTLMTKSGTPARAPAIEIEGSRLGVLDSEHGSLDEKTIRAYLELAKATGADHGPTRAPGPVIRTTKLDPRLERAAAFRRAKPAQEHPVKAYMWKHRVGLIIAALSAFLGLAWLAPLLDSWGFHDLAHGIFNAYRLVCVQTPERSPIVAGHQCCLCWRCVAIYGGSLLFGIIYVFGRDFQLPWLRWLTRPVAFKGLLLLSVPMIADGLSHTLDWRPGIEFAHSTSFWLGWGELQFDWWMRILTALLATIGAVRFLCPRLDRAARAYAGTRSSSSGPAQARI